ncbi:hypothetical protein HF1_10810 [Mycoplasma haemofelis str. Langford 1]|uniref:Uncharacterized protein n=1 Tax=Mycoplasma haemofelis (strain Langford 1) TaxID=941640 RepID=E8ZIW8_MYCHL|nr:hypothetical protein [Mycoplasma haemofelis]CBY93089.1 hypothetical protein HF1_10810 [Mycoplasma haemofelis str. Langford 1]
MAWGLLKSVAVGGTATAAAGGGIAASSMISSNSKKEPSPITKSSSSMEEVSPAQESLPTPKPTCVIYEGDEPTSTGNTRVFKKLLKKFKDKEEFYAEFSSRPPHPDASATKNEISNACDSEGKNSNGNVYVWYGKLPNQNKKTWIYSQSMQQDWLNKNIDKSATTTE